MQLTGLIHNLWRQVPSRRRRQFSVLIALMILASLSEIISIGALIPFLAALTNPEKLFANTTVRPFIELIGINNGDQLLLPLTLAFGSAACLAGAMRLLMLWVTTKLAFLTGAEIGVNIYKRTLHQPYVVHCARNSSEVISGITVKSDSIISSIQSILVLISSLFMLLVIVATLIYINPFIAIAAFFSFACSYWLIIFFTRGRIRRNSTDIAKHSTNVVRNLNEGLGGIRDVILDNSQSLYCKAYLEADVPLRAAHASSTFIAASPRFAMEAIGILIIAGLAFVLTRQPEGISQAVPVLGAFALGAQRLLPILQHIYSNYVNLVNCSASVSDVLNLLDQPLADANYHSAVSSISFDHHLELRNLRFRYPDSPRYVLDGINLCIPRGSRVGFVGQTGSGKSTLLDVVMGLLEPSSGCLEVDGVKLDSHNLRAWQSQIAHVPQSIFLADGTIEENIALGVPKDKVDRQRVVAAAKQAQISDYVDGLPDKYETHVGERGVRLSGGQRQRIGIARALYKRAKLIVFDEATSALDSETETAVMHSIDTLNNDLTVLIIAHRITTLRNCSLIVELQNGRILRKCQYDEIKSYSDSPTIEPAHTGPYT